MNKEELHENTDRKRQKKIKKLIDKGRNKLMNVFSYLRNFFIKRTKKEIIKVLKQDEPTNAEHTPTEKTETPTRTEEGHNSAEEPTESVVPNNQSTEPTVSDEQSTKPSVSGEQPTDQPAEPVVPNDQSTKQTVPNDQPTEQIISNNQPADQSTEPTVPDEQSTDQTVPNDQSTNQIIPDDQLTNQSTEPTVPNDQSTNQTIPDDQLTDQSTEPTVPNDQSTNQPTTEQENNIESQINGCLANYGGLSKETIDLINIRLREIFENNNSNDVYAEGSEGKIFKIDINENGKKKQYLIAKKRYDNTYKQERDIHKLVQTLLPIGNDIVKIPELKAILNINKSNYIIMEFIEGKTIYTLTMEKIMQKHLGSDIDIHIENDKKADAQFQELCKRRGIVGRKKIDKFFEDEAKKIKLFSPEKGKEYEQASKDFFDKLHSYGIYHRDVHWKNVILGNDGKLYVIDFGKAVLAENEQEAYVGNLSDEETEVYSRDEWLESMIANATYSEDEREGLLESEKAKEIIKIINNSDSIIDIIGDVSVPKNLLPKKGRGTMNENTFKEEIKRMQRLNNKNIKLEDLLNSTITDIKILCFVQSIENLNDLLSRIEVRLPTIEKQLSAYKKDLRAEQTLFKKNNITPLEKDKEGLIQIRDYLTELKSFIENLQNSDTNPSDN